MVEQAVAALDLTPLWLDHIDDLWRIWELPDEAPDTSGQVSLLGFDGHVEQPTDVQFGESWIRFDSEAQADFVRTLAQNRMAPRRLAVPPSEVAGSTNAEAVAFIESIQRDLRDSLVERIGEEDPAFTDAFVQALSQLAAEVRTALFSGGRSRFGAGSGS
jgi:hypothetical protein